MVQCIEADQDLCCKVLVGNQHLIQQQFYSSVRLYIRIVTSCKSHAFNHILGYTYVCISLI